MKRIILVLLCSLAFVSPVSSVELNKPFHTGDNFTINLTDDWIQIPKEVLSEFSNFISEVAPKDEKESYDYGFQLRSSNGWLTYPYILIKVKKHGRLPDGKLAKLDTLRRDNKDTAFDIDEKYHFLSVEKTITKPIYDETSRLKGSH